MHVEAALAAAADLSAIGHRRVAVGEIDDASQVAVEIGLERLAQLGKVARQVVVEDLLRVRNVGNHAALSNGYARSKCR